MSFLLDTNVVSEWVKPSPNPGVVAWLAGIDEARVFLSVDRAVADACGKLVVRDCRSSSTHTCNPQRSTLSAHGKGPPKSLDLAVLV
jgi:hypothetical protein